MAEQPVTKSYYTRSCRKLSETHEKEPSSNEELNRGEEIEQKTEETAETPSECAICLEPCSHPARLPCGHIFCFLCLKGSIRNGLRCAMCRADIPSNYLDNPELVCVPNLTETTCSEESYQWYYEGKNGNAGLIGIACTREQHFCCMEYYD